MSFLSYKLNFFKKPLQICFKIHYKQHHYQYQKKDIYVWILTYDIKFGLPKMYFKCKYEFCTKYWIQSLIGHQIYHFYNEMITKLTSEKCIKSLNSQDWHSWHVENIVQKKFSYFYVHNTHKVYNLVLFKDFQSTIGDLDITKTLT